MRKIIYILLIFVCGTAKAQVQDIIRTKRVPATGANTNNQSVHDANLRIDANFALPRHPANGLYGAKDSSSYVYFNTTVNKVIVYRGSGIWDTLATTVSSSLSFTAPLVKTGSTVSLTQDNTPTSGSNNPVKSNGIFNALATKQNTITTGSTAQYFRGDLSLATFPTIPTSLPPSGPAGGDLTGTYPNPTINTINGITKSFYDPTSSIQTQLNGIGKISTWVPGSYPINFMVQKTINGKSYIFRSTANNNTTLPLLKAGVQPWTLTTGIYIGAWGAGTYVVNNVVSENGQLYICVNNTSDEPAYLTASSWVKLGPNLGVFSSSHTGGYLNGDVVIDGSNHVYQSNIQYNKWALSSINNNQWEMVNGIPFGIAYWGNSLVQGTGSTGGYNSPYDLQVITGSNVYNGGVAGDTPNQIQTRFNADSTRWTLPTIFDITRNGLADTANIIAVQADLVAKLNAQGNFRYLVLGCINGNYESSPDRALVAALNLRLASIYGDKFVDIFAYLLTQYNPADPVDAAAHAAGNIAPSISSDFVHRNNRGYELMAEYLAHKLSYIYGNNEAIMSNVQSQSAQVVGNILPELPSKEMELLYDPSLNKGYIQSYDRINSVPGILSLGSPSSSTVNITEQGGHTNWNLSDAYSTGGFSPIAILSSNKVVTMPVGDITSTDFILGVGASKSVFGAGFTINAGSGITKTGTGVATYIPVYSGPNTIINSAARISSGGDLTLPNAVGLWFGTYGTFVNGIQSVSGNSFYYGTSHTFNGTVLMPNYYSTSATPSATVNTTNAGTGATITVTGSNQHGTVKLVTGTGGVHIGAMFTVTMSGSFAYPISCTPTLTNLVPSAMTAGITVSVGPLTSTTWTLQIGGTGILDSSTYSWTYNNGGY